MTSVKLPDGSVKTFDKPMTVKKVAKSIGSGLAKAALWGEIDLQPVPLSYTLPTDTEVNLKIITKTRDFVSELPARQAKRYQSKPVRVCVFA